MASTSTITGRLVARSRHAEPRYRGMPRRTAPTTRRSFVAHPYDNAALRTASLTGLLCLLLLGGARTRRAVHASVRRSGRTTGSTMLHGPVDLLSIGVKPACGAPCCFQSSASTNNLTDRAHDAKRQRVFWCWQVHDGKSTAAGERFAQSIDRPFRHVRSDVNRGSLRSCERSVGG